MSLVVFKYQHHRLAGMRSATVVEQLQNFFVAVGLSQPSQSLVERFRMGPPGILTGTGASIGRWLLMTALGKSD